jgi:L-ascorbate metabolism protein UlaG (beta-lactamase superfamily)
MSSPIRRFARIGAATLAIGLATGATFLAFAHEALQPAPDIRATPVGGEAPFLAENNVAMKKMMNDMAVTPTGDVDADFVAMMVPHHQGAIDMAVAVLRHSRNPQIRRLAQEIIVTQQQEIAAMRLAVGQPLPPSLPSPTQPSPRPAPDARTMQ